MSKGFNYSKWDKIELSDDEDDLHPNIDKESWFRMKHRSRVEREENEAKEIKLLEGETKKANKRIKVLEHDLSKLDALVIKDVTGGDDEDEDDDDLDDREGLEAELKELRAANQTRVNRLDEIEKNKKWNVDNMCEVKEERTIINASATTNFTDTGFAKAKDEDEIVADVAPEVEDIPTKKAAAAPAAAKKSAAAAPKKKEAPKKVVAGPTAPTALAVRKAPKSDAMETYHEFTEKYAEIVEHFMTLSSLESSKDYLLKYGDVLLQENASNYLLLASLEDEMNGFHTKMKLTCRQSQMITNIAELAKTMQTHPGNVVVPFFGKLDQKPFYDGFMDATEAFSEKIAKRAVTKKIEMDEAAAEEAAQVKKEGTDLEDIPKEERLGPGGLDPLEVIETLPIEMQQAFESRDVATLKNVLLSMDPDEAQNHMKRCIDSGLWVDQA
jgi:cell division cycle protein 37